jgi:hypothetical protein
MVGPMFRPASRWVLGCAIVAAMATGSTAVAAPSRGDTATAASAYGAKVKRVLDLYKQEYTAFDLNDPSGLWRVVRVDSHVAGGAATSLDHLTPPARWRATQRRTSRALRQLSKSLGTLSDQLKGKKSRAAVVKVITRVNKKLLLEGGEVEAAITALRKAT